MNKLSILYFIETPLNQIKKNWLITYFFFYLILIIIASFLYGFFLNSNLNLYDKEFNLISENIPFSNGEIIFNLQNFNKYFTEFLNIKFYLQKTPAIPILVYSLSLISENFFFIIIFKNLIFFGIYFFVAYISIKSINKTFGLFLVISLIPLILPYNLGVALNFVYEDCLIAIILPSIFLLLITDYDKKYLIIGVLLFILYFVKTSVLFLILFIPFIIIFIDKKSLKKYLPLFFSLIAILIWGSYGFLKTNKFSILSNSSSFNSYVMNFALNENFHKYYPNKSTDLIPIDNKILPKYVDSEWKFNDYFKEKNNEYLKENLNRYIVDSFIKIKFIFFGVHRDGAHPDENGNFNNKLRYSQLISKIILNLSIIILLFKFFTNRHTFFKDKKNIYFVVILFFSLLPHVIVWATSKHLIGVINVSTIYFIFILSNLKKKI